MDVKPKYTTAQLQALRDKIEEIRARTAAAAPAWHCPSCCNVFGERPPRGRCTECGAKLFVEDMDPRQKGDDDGQEYGHPGDELEERRAARDAMLDAEEKEKW